MTRLLTGKTALVTGSIAGLGYALANGFAEAGANVILNGLCTASEGEATAASLAQKHDVDVHFEATDLRDRAAVDDMMNRTINTYGSVDILANNAVIRHFAQIEDFITEDWDEEIEVNLSAAFRLVQLCLPGMKARKWGRIFNLTSIYSQRGEPHRIGYITTKSALAGMTRGIAIETARDGITCNSLAPGVLPTPAILGKIQASAQAVGRNFDEMVEEYAVKRHPTGRLVQTETVAALAVFLCGTAGDDITGANFPMDGGWQAG